MFVSPTARQKKNVILFFFSFILFFSLLVVIFSFSRLQARVRRGGGISALVGMVTSFICNHNTDDSGRFVQLDPSARGDEKKSSHTCLMTYETRWNAHTYTKVYRYLSTISMNRYPYALTHAYIIDSMSLQDHGSSLYHL